MTGIGIVLLVSLTTGSFGRAGLVTAVGHAHRGRRRARCGAGSIDRVGQARVLITAALINTVSLAAVDHQRAAGLAAGGEPARRGRGRGRVQLGRRRRPRPLEPSARRSRRC